MTASAPTSGTSDAAHNAAPMEPSRSRTAGVAAKTPTTSPIARSCASGAANCVTGPRAMPARFTALTASTTAEATMAMMKTGLNDRVRVDVDMLGSWFEVCRGAAACAFERKGGLDEATSPIDVSGRVIIG